MEIEIVERPIQLQLYGFSGTAVDQCYGDMGFKLMSRMWEIVKSNKLPNKGINVWVYDPNELMFAGVELNAAPPKHLGLEQKIVWMRRYANYRHVGPYSKLKEVWAAVKGDLVSRGLKPGYPGLEMYGHWTDDESKLVTEILIAI